MLEILPKGPIQPLLQEEITSYDSANDTWNGDPSPPEVMFEQFILPSDSVGEINLFPDSYATFFFKIEKQKLTDIFYLGHTSKQNVLEFAAGATYFSVKLPATYTLNLTTSPRHLTNKKTSVSFLNTLFPAANFGEQSFQEKIKTVQRFNRHFLPYKHHLLIDYIINQSMRTDEPPNLRSLATSLSISSRELINIFDEKIGLKPKEVIQTLRFQQSLHFLLNENETVTETFLSTNFYDHAHFNKFFKNFTGFTPTELKKLVIH